LIGEVNAAVAKAAKSPQLAAECCKTHGLQRRPISSWILPAAYAGYARVT